jgi:hypothetical protein
MRMLFTAATNALMLAVATTASAECDRTHVGTISREPEKDSIGCLSVGLGDPTMPTHPRQGRVVLIGVRHPDIERETVGYVPSNRGG